MTPHRRDLVQLLTRPKSCATCAHRTPHQTCGEPSAAGLCPPDRYPLCWCCHVPEGGAQCPAWTLKASQTDKQGIPS